MDRRGPNVGGAPTDLHHPVFARFYAAVSPRMEPEGMGALRDELLADADGQVLEVGAGNGLNFGHYPATVAHVTAIEPEPHLRSMAETAAATASVPVTVRSGTAEALPIQPASVDTAVLCLVLCSTADPAAAVAELARVVRPGGGLLFLEHMAADTRGLRLVQRVADATLWPRLAGGCHTARRPLDTIRGAAFEVTRSRHLRFPDSKVPVPAAPHVLGAAQRR